MKILNIFGLLLIVVIVSFYPSEPNDFCGIYLKDKDYRSKVLFDNTGKPIYSGWEKEHIFTLPLRCLVFS